MIDRIDEIETEALAAIEEADWSGLEEPGCVYLGRKAELTGVLRGIADLPAQQRGPVGSSANRVRKALESKISSKAESLENAELERSLSGDRSMFPCLAARPSGWVTSIRSPGPDA